MFILILCKDHLSKFMKSIHSHQSTTYLTILSKMLILIFILAYQVYAQFSTSPTWIGNPYLETNSYQLIPDFQTVSQSGGANITFGQIYSVPPQVAFAIINYSGNDGLFDEDFFMRTLRVTQSLAELNVFMQGFTNIRILYVMYLAVHPDFQYHLNTFNDIEANYSTTGSMSLNPIDTYTNQIRVFTNQINYTKLCEGVNARHKFFGSDMTKNKIAVYLSGIFNYVKNGDLPEVKFDITTEAVNISYFKLTVTVNPTYQIDLLRLSFIAMDILNIESSKEYTIIYNTERYYFDQDYYIPMQKQFFNDVFIGMVDFNTQSPKCTIDFNLEFQPANGRIVVKKSVPHHLSYYANCGLKSGRLVTFYIKTWYCPPPFYYFNLLTDMCEDFCANYFYGNQTAGLCKPCPTGCVSCDRMNPDTCTNCDAVTDLRVLMNGSCECMEGYYQHTSSDVICTSCSIFDLKCKNCDFDQNFSCYDCVSGWYLDTYGICQQCTMIGCLQCISPNKCTLCDLKSNYTLVPNNTCQQCPISCTCDGYYLPIQTNLSNGNHYCSTVCGDGMKRLSQQCDDGNSEDFDGCSAACQIEDYWSCEQPVGDGLTCCVIEQQKMYMKVENIIKSRAQNAFQLTLSLQPHLPFLSASKLKDSLNITLTGFNITSQQLSTSQIQKIHLKYHYGSHVLQRQCNLTIKIQLNQQNQNCSMSLQASMLFYPDSSNNLPLMFFSPQNYQKLQDADKLVDVMMYTSYALLALSAIPCKIVGLQLFGVLQLAYFSLSQIQNLNLMMVPFIKLAGANGYNPKLFNSIDSMLQLPQRISSIEYDALFLNNCGVMLIVMIGVALIGFACYGMSFILPQNALILSIAKRVLKEGLITVLLFNSFNLAFAAGIHFNYSSTNQQGYILNSIAAIVCLVIPLIMLCALIFTEGRQFGQFKQKFRFQTMCQLYFVVTIIYRYVLGYHMAVKSQQALSSLIVIGFSLLFLLYNFVNLPFQSPLHNYRANICHLSQLGILFVANYYQSMKSTTSNEAKSVMFSPAFIEVFLIIVTIVASFIGLLYQIYGFVKYCRNKQNINHSFESVEMLSSIKRVQDQSEKSQNKDLKFNTIKLNHDYIIQNSFLFNYSVNKNLEHN